MEPHFGDDLHPFIQTFRVVAPIVTMDESSVSYGSPANGASPSANPILAQPPLPDTSAGDQREGTYIPHTYALVIAMLT